ncbi:MAG TPA: glycosyltransferase [Myxococcales bacterium]|jgi:glycosyltransferase involved in cell wall biosynthesis
MRVALVHDWLTGLRGGERVLEQLCLLYPEADIFTLVHEKGACGDIIESRRITSSFLNRLPREHYRRYLPLFPLAIRSLDLRGYDFVVSTSHAVAKGCRPPRDALHVSYVHTPMRYVWDQFDAYFGPGRADLPTRLAAHLCAPYLRAWDVRSTKSVGGIIANSQFVAERIRRYWGREPDAVVYPPVDTGRFLPASEGPEDYALVVSALVPYKRIELAVEAFTREGRPLLIAGDGPSRADLQARAGPTVRFLGSVAGDELPRLYARARFFVLPGEEDFGIAAVEAQAAGRPVLALGRGGAVETVVGGETGLFFSEPNVEAVRDAVAEMYRARWDPQRIRAHALRFDVARFRPELESAIDSIRRSR